MLNHSFLVVLVTATLRDHNILSQHYEYGYDIIAKQMEAKAQVRQESHVRISTDADEIYIVHTPA